jgi:hypothetical protein
MINRRPYVTEGTLKAGCAVVQGSADNKVTAPDEDSVDFIGVYPWEDNDVKEDGDPVGVALNGVVKVLLAGNSTAGKHAIYSAEEAGAFEDVPADAGTYSTCGVFLESGEAGEYVDMYIERGSVTVAGA